MIPLVRMPEILCSHGEFQDRLWIRTVTFRVWCIHALAEETATEISKERNPQGLTENARIAKEGADVAKAAREDVEKRLGRSVVSSQKAIDYIQSPEELPFEKPDEQ